MMLASSNLIKAFCCGLMLWSTCMASSPRQCHPLRIPLKKKLHLTTRHGLFNKTAAGQAHWRTIRKYQGNSRKLEGYGGLLKRRGRHVTSANRMRRQAARLTNQGNQMWTGLLAVGTPSQTFSVDFDTGSADLWLPSQDCNLSACASKNTYNSSASSTSQEVEGTFSIQYGDGSSTSGNKFSDLVKVGGISIRNQTFAAVSVMSDSLRADPTDGVLGLAYPTISHIQAPSIITNAYKQGLIPSKSFSFKLADEGSEIFLGGVDKLKFTGDLELHPVSSRSYWQIGGGTTYVDGQLIGSSSHQTIIDSGTTIIYGPESEVEEIYSLINGSSKYPEIDGLWKFPCSNTPLISFSWSGGRAWEVQRERMSLGQVGEDSTECIGAISSQPLGLPPNSWLLGDSFMASVYSSFDPTNHTIGFAIPV